MNQLIAKLIACLTLFAIICTSCGTSSKVGMVKPSGVAAPIPDSLYPPANLTIATHNEWTRGNYPKTIAEFRKQPLQKHDIVFLGNSITRQGRDWGKRLGKPGIKNRGIAGDVTDGVLARLGEIIYVQPTAVFLEIGINDLLNDTLSPKRTAANILEIVRVLHDKTPRTKIFVQTIFPTGNQNMVNKIKETNEIVRKGKSYKLFTLIDTYALFADEQGLMRKEYTNDGVHLTEKGYEVWVNHLKNYFK